MSVAKKLGPFSLPSAIFLFRDILLSISRARKRVKLIRKFLEEVSMLQSGLCLVKGDYGFENSFFLIYFFAAMQSYAFET